MTKIEMDSSSPVARVSLFVEELEHAKARGAKIYAEVVGYAATSDGHDMVAPSGEGGERAMRLALSTVDGPIDYINAHGTSTPAGDPPEMAAISRVFGEKHPKNQFNQVTLRSLTRGRGCP